MKTFVVIGLGRFGSTVAVELCRQGCEVLGIDVNEEPVQLLADQVTHAVCGDAREPGVLRSLGVGECDCAIVAGGDVGSSALITLNLKEMGVPCVICRAQSHTHRKVLEKIGADRVIFPEAEIGLKLAQGLSSANILNYIELSEDYGVVELQPPAGWHGKSLKELDVRNRYHVNVIAVRKGKTRFLNISPGADELLEPGDSVLTLGRYEDIDRLNDL